MIADNPASGPDGDELNSNDWHVFEADDGDLSMRLVCALAELEGIDPRDLEFTLTEYVDPEALNLLFSSDRATDHHDASVYLEIEGYDVYVTAPGRILIA
jgi:hypothetical protein